MSRFTAVLDACVLYPAPLRDFLLELAACGLFRARWSDMIHAEWMRNVLRDRPDLSAERLLRTRLLMDEHAARLPGDGVRGADPRAAPAGRR